MKWTTTFPIYRTVNFICCLLTNRNCVYSIHFFGHNIFWLVQKSVAKLLRKKKQPKNDTYLPSIRFHSRCWYSVFLLCFLLWELKTLTVSDYDDSHEFRTFIRKYYYWIDEIPKYIRRLSAHFVIVQFSVFHGVAIIVMNSRVFSIYAVVGYSFFIHFFFMSTQRKKNLLYAIQYYKCYASTSYVHKRIRFFFESIFLSLCVAYYGRRENFFQLIQIELIFQNLILYGIKSLQICALVEVYTVHTLRGSHFIFLWFNFILYFPNAFG